MFGEMLGLCLAQCWLDQGRPARFSLVEPGPGRGTLMADILRVTRSVPGFSDAAEIWLVEASPALRAVQRETLRGQDINWADQITDLPDQPIYLIANEFFDALPVRQFIRAKDGWQEQMIALDGDNLGFGLAAPMPVEALEDQLSDIKLGQTVETNPAAQAIIKDLARRISSSGGVAIVVDYGDWAKPGDTFQAVRSHKHHDPLKAPGQADLTAHVDFAALARAATDIAVTAMTPQGVLLERLGITARAQSLAGNLKGAPLEAHILAHRRLTHPDEMGSLFKALAFYPKDSPQPPGFD